MNWSGTKTSFNRRFENTFPAHSKMYGSNNKLTLNSGWFQSLIRTKNVGPVLVGGFNPSEKY